MFPKNTCIFWRISLPFPVIGRRRGNWQKNWKKVLPVELPGRKFCGSESGKVRKQWMILKRRSHLAGDFPGRPIRSWRGRCPMSGKIRRSAATIPVPAEAEKNTNTAAENRSGEEPQEKGDAEGNFYIAVNLIDRCPAAGDGASVRIPVTLSIQRLLIPAGLFPRHGRSCLSG